MVNGYCLKCRAHRELEKPERVELKDHRVGYRGTCPECRGKMFRMGEKDRIIPESS